MKDTEWLKKHASKACKEWIDTGLAFDDYDCKWVTSLEIVQGHGEIWWWIKQLNNGDSKAIDKIHGYIFAMKKMKHYEFNALLEYIDTCMWMGEKCSLNEYNDVAYAYGHV